ncbi:hypothetical protein D3C84_1180560 [compost metagenome]
MIDATQAHPDHQNHRQVQRDRQIRQVVLIRQGHAPAASAFDQGEVSLQVEDLPHRLQQ